MGERIRIGVELGMTIQVRGVDWLKPTVHAEIDFDEIPDEKTLQQRWAYLWTEQVGPQADELLDLLEQQIQRRLGPFRDPDVQHGPQVSQSSEPRESKQPEGDTY